MDSILISSVNCQGLGNMRKRRDVFHYLREKNFSVYCLQDTHFDTKLERYIESEWGYKCFFASYRTNSRGVAVLFNNNFEFSVQKVERDENGNFIMISFRTMDKDLLLVNVYGPNKDNPEFYNDLTTRIKKYENPNVIAVGDWNIILDPTLDCDNYVHVNNPRSRESLETMMLDLGLADVWRDNNPEVKRFTWRRSNPLKQGRLDFFLISDYLISYFENCDIHSSYRSDHSMISLTLKFGKEEKHANFWKFNTFLLRDRYYLDEINKEIELVIKEYSACDIDVTMDLPSSDVKLNIPDKIFLDFLLMKLRAKTISYAAAKKRKDSERENGLEKDIALMEQHNLSDEQSEELRLKKQELMAFREKKMEGVMLRSKARWVADGEKITNYFCHLEKRNFTSKRMSKLVSSGGVEMTNSEDIREEVYTFYRNLYKVRNLERRHIEGDLVNNIPKLSEGDKNSLEGTITFEEAGLALNGMKHRKSPGTDGFGSEFFKVFWKQLGPFVVRALNESFTDGELSTVQKEGIVICIPKNGKSKEYIKNWRPISLLNVVYKIGATCIANRLKSILSKLINDDQTGFVKNRFIGDNIRLIYDMIHYLDSEKLPGLLICLDFEKAFDSVDWNFMNEVLLSFGFGNDICQWINTFYCNIKSTVLINGKPTKWFKIERGCRQGDPISAYLFILCVEILAIMIREENEIKGIYIGDTEHKIAQFADDAQLMNGGDRQSFEKSMEIITTFGNVSGLFLNAEKTQAIWLGSYKDSKTIYMPHMKIIWNPSKFKILGVWFTLDLKACVHLNYAEKCREMKMLFLIWSRRILTPPGRIAVLKSLVLSKLIHLWILLPNPPDLLVSEIQTMCFRFVWNNKQDRISRKTVIRNENNGGLGIPCIKTYMSALKLAWLRKLKFTNHKWKNIVLHMYPFLTNIHCYGPAFFNSKSCNPFWKDMLFSFSMYSKAFVPKQSFELLSQPVFYNEKIKIGGKVLTQSSWIEKGIYKIAHFLKEDGYFLSRVEFMRKYDINVDCITFMSHVHSIKKYIKDSSIVLKDNCSFDTTMALNQIYSVKKGCKIHYDMLITDKQLPKCCARWTERINSEINWEKVFHKMSKIKEVKLKWLQMRIIHRILATNVILAKMKITENDKCSFCQKERDSIQHIFWQCEHTKRFWVQFEVLLKTCDVACNVKLTENIILFGVSDLFKTDIVFDHIIVEAKMYIYRCKVQKVPMCMHAFQLYLGFKYKIEQYNAKLNFSLEKFNKNWTPYKNIIQGNCL